MSHDPWVCRCGHEFGFTGIGTSNCQEVSHDCPLVKVSTMKYITYNIRGEQVEEGTLEIGQQVNVPTHGSVAIEVAEGRWLNFSITEWAGLSLDSAPTPAS